jgi:alpha-glucosidase
MSGEIVACYVAMSRSCLAALLALSAAGCSGAETTSAPGFPEKDRTAEASRLLTGPDWYRHAVFYEVYVRSLQDSNGDGIGDLPGLTSRLDDLKALGVDALWLMPIMPTPFKDSGYDVADYENVNPDYGTLADFDALISAAHDRNMRVIIDLVLNHTSDQHAWFAQSRSDKTNPKADWYVWSDTPSSPDIGCGLSSPTFGDSAWTFEPKRNQYYFHRFYAAQPDLNYRNPDVVTATLDAARFWLERGTDGFRCDVIGLLYESATACIMIPETVEYIKKLRGLLDQYPDRAMVAESNALSSAAPYFGNGHDMFHMAFDFSYGYFWGAKLKGANAGSISDIFTGAQKDYPSGAQDALVIGSHDVPRAYQVAQGLDARAHRAAVIQLTMPGTPFVYYGEELGMRPGTAFVVDSRDSARTPMLWDSTPGWGFTKGKPWLAFGASPETTNLEVEKPDAASSYAFYREILAFRRGREAFGTGTLQVLESDAPSVLWFSRASSAETYIVGVNLDEESPVTATSSGLPLSKTPKLCLGNGKLAKGASGVVLTLPAGGWAVFRVR